MVDQGELELVHLCDATFQLRDPITISDTPLGTRMVFEVESGTVTGERLNATVARGSASGDWTTLDQRGVATLDVRLVLTTADGAAVFSAYRGRADVFGGGPIYIAPTYDTGAEQYLWLNTVQAIGKGQLDRTTLTYRIFEAR
ncbi:MAG: DUF3237 domain-containing protein [Actinomycetota bacterium]|nr:DUF3237 domain-containing protein [Actinomycetota bacterium]